MKCPECGAWTEVKETRGPRRRRECANGHRFSTEEIVTGQKRRLIPPDLGAKIAAAPGSIRAVARMFNVDQRTVKRMRDKFKEKE